MQMHYVFLIRILQLAFHKVLVLTILSERQQLGFFSEVRPQPGVHLSLQQPEGHITTSPDMVYLMYCMPFLSAT